MYDLVISSESLLFFVYILWILKILPVWHKYTRQPGRRYTDLRLWGPAIFLVVIPPAITGRAGIAPESSGVVIIVGLVLSAMLKVHLDDEYGHPSAISNVVRLEKISTRE